MKEGRKGGKREGRKENGRLMLSEAVKSIPRFLFY